MTWNVYYKNFNTRKIEKWNVFQHSAFRKEVQELLEACDNSVEFAEKLDNAICYYFWCKCEYEVIISEWPPVDKTRFPDRKEAAIKVDIYDQLHMNWDAFVDYCWNLREEEF